MSVHKFESKEKKLYGEQKGEGVKELRKGEWVKGGRTGAARGIKEGKIKRNELGAKGLFQPPRVEYH